MEINANLQVDISDEIDTIDSDEDEATRFLIKEIHFIVNNFFFCVFYRYLYISKNICNDGIDNLNKYYNPIFLNTIKNISHLFTFMDGNYCLTKKVERNNLKLF